MNHNISDWSMEGEPTSFHDLLFPPEQKKTTGPNQEVIELVWRNGHVVTHSQNHQKSPFSSNENKQTHRLEPTSKCGVACGNPGNSIQEDETASWFQYPIDCTIDKEFCSEFFCEVPVANSFDADKLSKNAAEDVNVSSQPISQHYIMQENTMPPPKAHVSSENGGFVNFSHFSRPVRGDLGLPKGPMGEKILEAGTEGDVGESSTIMKISSSVCGSNQVQNHAYQSGATSVLARGLKEDVQKRHADTSETTISSSSGGSGSTFGRMGQQRGSNVSNKRKRRDREESECHSQEGGYQSIEANRPSTSARRSHVAELHNLSERRRRDRINEKMRALQELIPYCNKTDKASMLDEAIEYLKSLQLQVQLMWMGSGITPMMFPAFQHYILGMGMGMSHTTMPCINGPIPLPRVPVFHQPMPSAPTSNQTPMCHPMALNPLNFPRQTQNVPSLENYMQFLSFHGMQPPSQAMNLYLHGSDMVQQNWIPLTSSNGLPTEGGSSSGNIQNNASG